MLLVVEVVHLVHSKKDPPQYRLESISGIWQGTRNNHRHRIVNIGLGNFLFYRMSNEFFITWLEKFVLGGHLRIIKDKKDLKSDSLDFL